MFNKFARFIFYAYLCSVKLNIKRYEQRDNII